MNKKKYEKFQKQFEHATGFDVMEKQDDETYLESARHNLTWLRDWAEDTAQGLERDFTKGDYGK